jgi:hypothetical protein
VLPWWLCLFGPYVFAQDASVTQQIQSVRALSEAERQRTLVEGARISATEIEAFMPIYQEYRHRVIRVNDEMLELLKDYSDHYATLDDDRARALTRRWLEIERERLDLKERYVKKFDKVLSATKVARVLQIENRLDLLQQVGAASVVPLVKP